MNRETKEILLPITKSKIVIVTWMTAGELLGTSKAEDSTKYLISKLVTSFNEIVDKEKVFEAIMDLPIDDYKILDDALVELLPKKKEKEEEKKN